jgi:hypothetical protein
LKKTGSKVDAANAYRGELSSEEHHHIMVLPSAVSSYGKLKPK